MTIIYSEAVLNESDKTTIDEIIPLLNEYQRKAFLGLYCEKLRYGSATWISNFTGISPMTLIAVKRDAELENDPRARP